MDGVIDIKNLQIKLINLYQKLPGRWHSYCRYYPTCSTYYKQALEQYGFVKGNILGMKRILRCNPFSKSSGYDPLPTKIQTKKRKEEKRKNMKKLTYVLTIAFLTLFLTTGCFTNDNMEDIHIVTSDYPTEFLANYLYGSNATVTKIYPNDVNIKTYKLTNKIIKDTASKDLFIYNGLGSARDIATKLLDKNETIKIIDSTYGMSSNYTLEESWLNPANLLMMAKNIKAGLEEYINNKSLKDKIDASYDKLEVSVSEIDATIKLIASNSVNKNLVVSDNSLNWLSKYGFIVYNLNSNLTDKEKETIKELYSNKKITYIIDITNSKESKFMKELVSDYKAQKISFDRLDNISEENKNNALDFLSIYNNNLEVLKKELFE